MLSQLSCIQGTGKVVTTMCRVHLLECFTVIKYKRAALVKMAKKLRTLYSVVCFSSPDLEVPRKVVENMIRGDKGMILILWTHVYEAIHPKGFWGLFWCLFIFFIIDFVHFGGPFFKFWISTYSWPKWLIEVSWHLLALCWCIVFLTKLFRTWPFWPNLFCTHTDLWNTSPCSCGLASVIWTERKKGVSRDFLVWKAAITPV